MDGELIKQARQVEMETFKKHGVCGKFPLKERWRVTGKAAVAVKWVDTNEGDTEKPVYRCRLVVKEIKIDEREDLFAATPSLEAKKVLASLFASAPEACMNFIDVVQAYFRSKARRSVYVDLPREHRQEEMRGELKKTMCGTRAAAHNWELEYTEMMVEAGFTQGSCSACVFYREQMEVHEVDVQKILRRC